MKTKGRDHGSEPRWWDLQIYLLSIPATRVSPFVNGFPSSLARGHLLRPLDCQRSTIYDPDLSPLQVLLYLTKSFVQKYRPVWSSSGSIALTCYSNMCPEKEDSLRPQACGASEMKSDLWKNERMQRGWSSPHIILQFDHDGFASSNPGHSVMNGRSNGPVSRWSSAQHGWNSIQTTLTCPNVSTLSWLQSAHWTGWKKAWTDPVEQRDMDWSLEDWERTSVFNTSLDNAVEQKRLS